MSPPPLNLSGIYSALYIAHMTRSARPTQRSLPIALLRAREIVMEPVRVMLQRSGISEQKWRVLRVVEESGPMEHTAIAHAASLLLPSLTRLSQSMVEDGLLTRATDPNDKRKAIIGITEKGRALIHEHLAESEAIFARMTTQFGAERMEQLLDLLEDFQSVRL